jgi:hypothetical protein
MASRVAAHNANAPIAQRIQWYCPQLPPSPAQAMDEVMRWVYTPADKIEPLEFIRE